MGIKPSSRFTYALRAMVDLAVHEGTGPVTTAAIAKRQGIPVRSLEQLFNRLRRNGLVVAERGPRGGYRLRYPPGDIPIRAIFEVIEPGASTSKTQDHGTSDPARSLWQQVETAVRSTLDAATLETLAAQVRDTTPGPIEHHFTFHI